MRTNKIIPLFGLVVGIITGSILMTGCKSSSGKGGTYEPVAESAQPVTASTQPVTVSPGQSVTVTAGQPVSGTTTQKVEFLFVQNANDVTSENGTMTLHGVNPVTVCFADRPERIAGHMPTANIVPMWGEGRNSFTANPPNATLSVLNGGKESDVVVVLRNPRLSGNDLTYDVQTLEGTSPAHGGPCSLFIDIIGMPLTPYSYAGAARRAYRRGYLPRCLWPNGGRPSNCRSAEAGCRLLDTI